MNISCIVSFKQLGIISILLYLSFELSLIFRIVLILGIEYLVLL